MGEVLEKSDGGLEGTVLGGCDTSPKTLEGKSTLDRSMLELC